MNTSQKGDIGEAVVIAEATKKGYSVLIPLSGHKQYDLVLDKNNKLLRIQVKFSSGDGEVVKVKGKHSSGREPYVTGKYTKNEIDAIIVYDASLNKTFFIPAEILGEGRNAIWLRVKEPKTKEYKKIIWAKDFENW